ncbi:ABC transporter permease [Methanocaldococcus infernus]|nr:iron export ABC transporter permease subunit FetB [Methanocaldococcus infernus]
MLSLILSSIFVILSIIIARFLELRNEKEIILSSFLVLIQLLILGYLLLYIFTLKLLGICLMFFVMIISATVMIFRKIRVKNRIKFFYSLFLTFFLTTLFIISLLILFKVISLTPRDVIPLMGMVVGNSLNTVHLLLDKLGELVKRDRDQILGMLALGATEWIAIKLTLISSIRSAIIPHLNRSKSVGLIFIPGAMVGLILAGYPPIEAAKIQIIIMWMILTSSLLSSLIISILTYKEFLRF